MKTLDVVLLKDGRTATILEVFDNGKAFMVEIADSEGRAIDLPVVEKGEIEKITYHA